MAGLAGTPASSASGPAGREAEHHGDGADEARDQQRRRLAAGEEAVANGETEVHALDAQALLSLRAEDPLLYTQVHRNVAVHLSQRLRAAAWAWRASTS